MKKAENERFAQRLARALVIRGMKQSELCSITKIPKSAMSQYVSGSFEPKQDRVHIIAKSLDVDEAWLMGYDVPMEREKANSPSEPPLTEGEKLMLELFRKIPEEKQPEALNLLRVALKMQQTP